MRGEERAQTLICQAVSHEVRYSAREASFFRNKSVFRTRLYCSSHCRDRGLEVNVHTS